MPFTLVLPEGYGYAAAIALGVIPFMSFAHGTIVGIKRNAAKVTYPNAYASAEEAKKSKEAHAFNCAQRAHGNFLENMPQTMIYILFAGAFYPQATTALAALWVVFRMVFAYGYIYSDKPNGSGRLNGSAFWLVQATLWGMCLYAGFTKLI